MTIKKVFDGVFDEEVHDSFIKFGRGEYSGRFLIEAKRQTNKWAIKTSAEYVNYLVRKCLEKVSGNVAVKGIIVSTLDLREEVNFEIKKAGNFQGIRKLQIDTEVNAQEILGLMEKYPRVFFALSFKGENFQIKVKAKAPKSGKPGKKDEEGPKADFCTLKTNDESIVKEILFDVSEFKEVKVTHTIVIEDIVYPKDFANMKPAEVREKSKRKGKIIREATVDGVKKVSEANFVA